jgi:hypothetical protein
VHQELARFKWQMSNRAGGDMVNVWRRNIQASPALCFTTYKVIGATLKSVVIYLPDPTHLRGHKTFSLSGIEHHQRDPRAADNLG